jgi:hypothetical protein
MTGIQKDKLTKVFPGGITAVRDLIRTLAREQEVSVFLNLIFYVARGMLIVRSWVWIPVSFLIIARIAPRFTREAIINTL